MYGTVLFATKLSRDILEKNWFLTTSLIFKPVLLLQTNVHESEENLERIYGKQ